MKWEYLTVGATDEDSDRKLEEHGRKGWELVHVSTQRQRIPESHGEMMGVRIETYYTLWFKRPRSDDQKG